MRKLGIALTTLLLLGVLVLMLFGSGLLPFSATEGKNVPSGGQKTFSPAPDRKRRTTRLPRCLYLR